MNIPDKAVEAVVALAFKDAYEAEIDFDYEDLDGLRARIRKTLEAAAPHIAAQALRDYADSATATYELGSSNDEADFARSDLVNDLRARADELDPQ